MTKKIVILLSMLPEEGGKFQYSISLLEGLESLDIDNYKIFAIYYNALWTNYLGPNIEKIFIRKKLFARVLRKLILWFPNGLTFWRKISKYIDPVYREIFKIKPALVFIPGNYEYSFEAEIQAAVPIFDLMHRYEPHFPEVSESRIFRKREYIYHNISRYAKVILADSQLGKEQIIESYASDNNKIFVLPYTVPKYIYASDAEVCREKYNLPEKYIFYPAQFWMHKNHRNLIKAINLLKLKGQKINAVFVGSKKNYYGEIIKLVNELKLNEQIRILDYVSNNELIFIYKNATALVMPTFFGPTNIPPLEAFALGCPVVISKIYSMPEQVGDAALLFDPTNEIELSENIKQVYFNEQLRQSLIRKGYERNSNWNQKNYNKILKDIIDEVLQQR